MPMRWDMREKMKSMRDEISWEKQMTMVCIFVDAR